MRMWNLGCLLMASVVLPAAAAGQTTQRDHRGRTGPATTTREAIESLEGHLEQAVAEVSPPHAGILLGRAGGSRGYRLPGYGIVFVLSPRALPGREGAVFVVRRGPGKARGGPGEEHRELELSTTVEVEEIEAIEQQVLILQHAAEAQRRAAEEDHERIVHDLRIRLAAPEVRSEAGEGERRRVVVHEDTPPPPPSPGAPAPPPWRFWFGEEVSEEGRTPDRVVEDVRGAVIGVLEARALGVAGLGAEEFVTVAVDFVPGGLFAAHRRPTRTLIVRARQKDLDARARGKIASKELRTRVEVFEY